MAFLTWDNQADADTSLAAVNVVYGCPIQNGYTMNTWADVSKSITEDKWGFAKPEEKHSKTLAELEAVLIPGFTEHDARPEDWVASEEE